MRCLVTGGAGFIGSALVRGLVGDGAEVLTVDKLTYAGRRENLAAIAGRPSHRLIAADICDTARMAELIAGFRPDAIYHLAAESHVDRSIDGPAEFIRTNVAGTGALLEAALAYWRGLAAEARHRFRFLNVSTDEVYGELGAEGHFREHDPYRPNSPYAAAKAGADHLARAFGRTYGLPVIVSNCGNNYGPYQFPEKLIPLMILNALAGEPLPVYGDGAHVRDWIHVDDHVRALRRIVAAGRAGETYLIGARSEKSNLEIVQALSRILDRLVPDLAYRPHRQLITFVADRPGHDRRYAIDPGKIETELGWQPRESFESGLAKTVAWYLANREWCAGAAKTYDRGRLGLAEAKP